MLDGVNLNPLKIIHHPKGNIMHALKSSDPDYVGFGEAYFSAVAKGEIKGWKMHHEMTLNLIVPVGAIRFVLFDERPHSRSKGLFWEEIIGIDNYQRLTVPPLIWLAFQGISPDLNLLLNLANIEHNPVEAENRSTDEIDFNWGI
ncbi:dTDP-4-dehydrorhamnose 3,5-epimerase [Pedobacter steynii]|nr:dTDP-4-dehydrorhamnose 3,5-epimerase [Pedobacter steynii]